LIKRLEEREEPYITEEYKLPVTQELIKPSNGVVYAYYKTIRNEQRDIYLTGFYFEHYPDGEVEHDWE
jgi:hypothetical protein